MGRSDPGRQARLRGLVLSLERSVVVTVGLMLTEPPG